MKNLFGLFLLGMFLLSSNCPQNTLPTYSVVIGIPACVNDNPYQLQPGEKFELTLRTKADESTFKVVQSLRGDDLNFSDDITMDFQPQPFNPGDKLTAVPRSFQFISEGDAFYKLEASAKFKEPEPKKPITSWSCSILPYTIRAVRELDLKVGEIKEVKITFSSKAINDMEFRVEPFAGTNENHNITAISIDGHSAGEAVSFMLNKDEKWKSIFIEGAEIGSLSLFYLVPGGKFEETRITVAENI